MNAEEKTVLRNTEETEHLKLLFSLWVKNMNEKNSLEIKNPNFPFLDMEERRLSWRKPSNS